MKLVRAVTAYFGLLASVLLSHLIGGGKFIEAPQLILFTFLTVALLTFSIPTEFEGPRLALLALIAQTFGHFLFGGGSLGNSMMISHVAGGIIGYQLVARMDQIMCGLDNLVQQIFIPIVMHIFAVLLPKSSNLQFAYIARIKSFLLNASYSLRAPPLLVLN